MCGSSSGNSEASLPPYGTSTPFGSQRPPAKIDPQVLLGARGALVRNRVRRESAPRGTQASSKSLATVTHLENFKTGASETCIVGIVLTFS
jgi:hypothetical protein